MSLAGPSAGWVVAPCGVAGGTAADLVHLHHQGDRGPGMGCVHPSVGAADWVSWAETFERLGEAEVVTGVWVWAGLG